MRVTDVPANAPDNAQKGPLLSLMDLGSNSTGAVLGYADKNKIKRITELGRQLLHKEGVEIVREWIKNW